MDIEVRFVEGCPNLPVIRERLPRALEFVGRPDVEVRLRAVHTAQEAAKLGFTGSPTILIDGCDPFPQHHAAAALSCRLYPTAQGTARSPSVEQLAAAMLWQAKAG